MKILLIFVLISALTRLTHGFEARQQVVAEDEGIYEEEISNDGVSHRNRNQQKSRYQFVILLCLFTLSSTYLLSHLLIYSLTQSFYLSAPSIPNPANSHHKDHPYQHHQNQRRHVEEKNRFKPLNVYPWTWNNQQVLYLDPFYCISHSPVTFIF